jgi:GNAT superfamily N-acetyltransferase
VALVIRRWVRVKLGMHEFGLGRAYAMDAASYSAIERLRCGRQIEIRALRPADRADFVSAVGQVGAQSLYRRFFSPKSSFTEEEIVYFVNVDFTKHVALVATIEDAANSIIIGGARYIVIGPGKAEVAFAVIDAYQGRGVGTALMRHLAVIAREAGVKELVAEVLAENTSMLGVFARSGMPLSTAREGGVVHIALELS